MGRARKFILLGFLALLIVPVLLKPLTRPEPRKFHGVRLADTRHQEVSFHNERQDIALAGLLFEPVGEGPFPAAVIIHGSGSSRRDNGWYLTLVHYLQQNGVVVLLPDKRGSERSGGDWRTASYADLATDTLAAVEWLQRQVNVDPQKIGVVGLSEGGHIAPLAANQMPELTFVVSVVGSTIPMHELLVYEENHNLREFGILPGLSNILAYPAAWSLIYVRRKTLWDAIGNFDSAPHWERLTTAALVLFGEDDTNVPSARSAAVLRSMGKPHIEVKIYPGSGHALESPIGEGTSIFRMDALQDILRFIRQATRESSQPVMVE